MTGLTGKALRFAGVAVLATALAGCQTSSITGALGLGGGARTAPKPTEPEVRERELRLASAARGAKQYDVAHGIYTKLLLSEPNAADLLIGLAEMHFEQGAFDRSLAAYDRALAGETPSERVRADALTGRGRARLASNRPADAAADFRASLERRPDNPIAINGLGVSADMEGRHLEAQSYYRQALALDPGNERVRSNLGLSLALAARFDDAVAELAPLAGKSAHTGKARHNLALALGLMGKQDQALRLSSGTLDSAQAADNGRFYAATRKAVAAEAGMDPATFGADDDAMAGAADTTATDGFIDDIRSAIAAPVKRAKAPKPKSVAPVAKAPKAPKATPMAPAEPAKDARTATPSTAPAPPAPVPPAPVEPAAATTQAAPAEATGAIAAAPSAAPAERVEVAAVDHDAIHQYE